MAQESMTVCMNIDIVETEMHIAVCTDDFFLVHELILRGRNIDEPRSDGKTALMLAVTNNCYRTIGLLLAHDANMDAADDNGETALQMAFNSKETHPGIVEEFLGAAHRQYPDKEELVRKLHQSGCTLAYALYLEDYEVMKGLLDLGVDVNSTGYKGETALHVAVERNQLRLVNCLLNAGANVNVTDDFGQSVLSTAAVYGNSILVNLLLKHGADPNAETFEDGATPLIEAVRNSSKCDQEEQDYQKCVELLILHGAVPSQKNGDYPTVFDQALLNGNLLRIDILICYLALREMQGDSMARTIVQCKLDDNQYILPKLFECFENCQRTLMTNIYQSITLFDLLTSSERKFRSFMRNQHIYKIVSKLPLNDDAELFKEHHLYRVMLQNRLQTIPSPEMEDAAIGALGRIFCKTYNECYVFAREIAEYLSYDSLYELRYI